MKVNPFPTTLVAFAAALPSPRLQAQESEPPAPSAAFDEWPFASRFAIDVGGNVNDRDVNVRFGGRAAFDFARFDQRNSNSNGVKLGALRPLFEVDVGGRSQVRAEFDLDGVDSRNHLLDLWVRQELGSHLTLEIGQLRVAMGSEYATREENLPLVGYGYTSYLTGRYDFGVRATVLVADDALHLEGVATIGSGFGLEGEGKGDPLFLGRATLEPLRQVGNDFLAGFFVGGSFAVQPRYRDELLLATPYQTTVFTTRDLHGDEAAWALAEAGWRGGPVRLGAEAVRGVIVDVNRPGGGHRDIDRLFAWSAYVSFCLTGENARWERGRLAACTARVSRLKAVDDDAVDALRIDVLESPIELALRYSAADLDNELFTTGLAARDPSTEEVRSFSVNVTFHVARGTRFEIGAVRTLAHDDLSVFGGGDRDTSYLARLEIDF